MSQALKQQQQQQQQDWRWNADKPSTTLDP